MEKEIAVMAIMVMLVAGFNSAVLLMDDPEPVEHVTVTVDLGGIPGPQTIYLPTDSGEEGETQPASSLTQATDALAAAKKKLKGISPLFSANTFLILGDKAYCTDVLGAALIAHGLGLGGASSPEGRTELLLTQEEHDGGNLIIVGGPAVSPVATEFASIFGITYEYTPEVSFQVNAEGKSLFLDLKNYPETDICIVYLGQNNGRNVLQVWGYQWQGTYAGALFAADPETWETYKGAHLFMLRWTDANGDGLIQKAEIFVEEYV